VQDTNSKKANRQDQKVAISSQKTLKIAAKAYFNQGIVRFLTNACQDQQKYHTKY